MITQGEIVAAQNRIAGRVRQTPILELEAGALGLEARLGLKLESLQHTGSFKPRGAFNRMLSQPIPDAGVIAASGGNHGAAVAFAARALGVRAEIFVPEIASPVKVARLRDYGADVHQIGAAYAAALEASRARQAETGALEVHAYDQPEVVAGQGTVGLELERQVPDVQTVLVAVGGGGLVGGIASWFAGRVRVIGVESEGCPTLHAALEAGQPVNVSVGGIAADSLGARRIGQLGFEAAQAHLERVALVPDEAILEAQRWLWDQLRLVAEPGGATALAALISGAYQPRPSERVVVLVCGANTDLVKLASL